VRAALLAAILSLLGALAWFAPFLAPGHALLGTHPALYRPFAGDDAARLFPAPLKDEIERAARPLYGDKLLQHDPEVRFSWMRRGDPLPPTWNPQVLGGVPHLATGLSSSFAPWMWLAAAIEPPRCYAVIATVMTALGGWFAFLMLRAFGVAPAAAGFGALLFAGSGWMSIHQEYFQLTGAATFLPLALFGAKRIVDAADAPDSNGERPWRGVLSLGAAIGCAFLSGFPQIAIYSLLAAGLLIGLSLAVGLARRTVSLRRAGRIAAAGAFAAIGGLGLASPQLLATAEFVRLSSRTALDASVVERQALPPGALLGLLFPELLGRAPTQAEIAEEERRARDERRAPRNESLFGLALADTARPDVRNNPFEIGCALGPAALLLALFGALASRRGARLFFVLLAALGFALALPGPLLHASVALPGLDIGDPKRALFLAQAALGVLAVLGLERAFADERAGRRATALLGACTLLFFVLAAAAGFLATPERLVAWSAPRIAASVGLPEAEVRAGLPAVLVGRGRDLLLRELAGAGLFCALAMVTLAWRQAWRARPLLPTCALFAALALPLALFWRHATAPIPTAGLDARPPLVDLLLREPPRGRIVHVAPAGGTPALPPKLPMLYGVRDVQGYVAAYVRSWQELFEAIEPHSTLSVGILPLRDPGRLALPLFRLLDVEYALVELPHGVALPALAGWSEVAIPGATAPSDPAEPVLHLLRSSAPLGRASLVPTVRVFPDEPECLRRLVDPAFEPEHECCANAADAERLAAAGFVDAPPGPGEARRLVWPRPEAGDGGAARATALDLQPAVLRFRTEGDGGLLVLSDVAYPTWRARVDGRDVPIFRVDHALRGVVVPAGDHVVEFADVPRPLLLGLFLAPAAFVLLLVVALTRRDPADAAIVAPWPTRSAS
jgi:hypothetical protein